jgi:hypothetical protein
MLAQATATVPYRFRMVASALLAQDHGWSVALDGDGGDLLAKVGIKVGILKVYKHVQLSVGVSAAALHSNGLMLPVSWAAVGGPPIFPRMEGTLHAEPAPTASTKLTLNASYDPPLGKLGRLIDRAVLYRLAQITMNDFTTRLAQALSAQLELAETANRQHVEYLTTPMDQ